MFNCPTEELNRSPAAQVVASLASASGMFLRHFEHRHHLSFPDRWIPSNRPDLSGETKWVNGVLKEHKYLHFRYDQPLGSFHPSHRAKWTTHELCHGLVGFTWRSDMTPFAHSLAARLSELLPVALWYFFDEIQLRRCPLHYLQGPLFRDHCVYCDLLAKQGPRLPEPEDDQFRRDGLNFVRDELAMIMRSKRFGRPLPNRFATIDLNSDALAYVAQQQLRMEDPLFRKFIELFHGPHTGMWADLEELEGRVWGLTEALSGGLPANPLSAGSDFWIAQDLGWRLLTLSAQCEDEEAVESLEEMAEALSKTPTAISQMIEDYHKLYEAFFLPDPEAFFAVGYPLIDNKAERTWGSDGPQLYQGVDSSCPSLVKALGPDGLSEQISAFAGWDLDRPQRLPIGKRFAQFLTETAPGPLAELATYESALQHPESPDPWAASLNWNFPEGKLVRRAQGVEVLKFNIEVDRLIEALHDDDDQTDIPERKNWMLVSHQPGGIRHVVEITEQSANAINLLAEGPLERALLNLTDEEWDLLIEANAITPCSWHIYRPDVALDIAANREGPLPDALSLTSSQGLWRQSQRVVTIEEEESDREAAVEPAIRQVSTPPEQITASELKPEEVALRSLEALSSTIAELSGSLTQPSSGLKPRRAPTPLPRFGRDHTTRQHGQRSTAEALIDMGYQEDRPPATPFEVQLRQALSQSANVPEQEGSTHEALEDMEDLFQFDGLSELIESGELSLDSKDEDLSVWTESDPWPPSLGQLQPDLIAEFESVSHDHLQPAETNQPPPSESASGQEVGFGERWRAWEEE